MWMWKTNPTSLNEYSEQIRRAHSWWNIWRDQWATIGTGFTIVAAFATLLAHIFQMAAPVEVVTQCVLLVIFSAVVFGISAVLFWRSVRHTRLLAAIFSLHFATHVIRNEVRRLSHLKDREEAKRAAIQVARVVLEATRCCFTIVLGTNCRVALKIFLANPPAGTPKTDYTVDAFSAGAVVTFARDLMTDEITKGIREPISLCGFKTNRRFFAFHDNPEQRCVVIPDVKDPTDENNNNDDVERDHKAPRFCGRSPYRSEMIWPVRCPLPAGHDKKQDLLGFLIVDCYRKNAFSETDHFDLGATLADAIYTFLDQLQLLIPNQPGAQQLQANEESSQVHNKGVDES